MWKSGKRLNDIGKKSYGNHVSDGNQQAFVYQQNQTDNRFKRKLTTEKKTCINQ